MKKSKTIISLDIGSYSIKVLELEKNPQGGKILDFLEFHIQPEESKSQEETIAKSLKEIWIKKDFKNKSVISVLPRYLCSVKYITLPSQDYQEISQMFPFEAEKGFPFSLTKFELGLAIQKILPNKNSRILLAAIEKNIIEKHLHQLEKANLVVERVGLSSLALSKAYLYEEKENAALVHLGEAATEINIIHQETLAFTRSFPIAGKHLTEALMSDLNLTREEAEKLKLEGSWPKDKNLSRVEEWYKRLRLEIKQTMKVFLEDYPQAILNQIIISGGGSKLSGLKEKLNASLNLPISFFPSKKAQASLAAKKDFLENTHLFPIALGLGLEEDEVHPLNFIPQDFQRKIEQKEKQKKIVFVALATLGLLLLLEISLALGLLWQTGRKKIIQRNLAELKPEATEVMERREEIKLLEAYLKEFSPLEVLKNLSQVIPESILFTRLSLDKDGKGEITGLTLDHSEVSELIKNLEKSSQFYNVFSRYSRTRSKGGKNLVEFAILFSVER